MTNLEAATGQPVEARMVPPAKQDGPHRTDYENGVVDGWNQCRSEIIAATPTEAPASQSDLSRSFLDAHKIKKYQARAVRIAMEVLKRHAEFDADSFKALKALEHNFKDYL